MALSIIELNHLHQNRVKPLGVDYIDLAVGAATRQAIFFSDNEKTVPPENEAATLCLQKQQALIQRIMNQENGLFQNFNRRTINKLGAGATTLNEVRVYSDADWGDFYMNNIPQIFDDVAGITDAERTAYNGV